MPLIPTGPGVVDPRTGLDVTVAEPPAITPLDVSTFPADLALALTTTKAMKDDIRIERAVDGTGRSRSFYTMPVDQINAHLAGITESQLDEFETFYLNNRGVAFQIPWGCDSPQLLSVAFNGDYSITYLGNGLATVDFLLVRFP